MLKRKDNRTIQLSRAPSKKKVHKRDAILFRALCSPRNRQTSVVAWSDVTCKACLSRRP